MNWISVEDRLPEEGKYVLVWDGNRMRDDNSPYYEIAANRKFPNGNHWICGPYSLLGITHWMPLPEPPK